MVLLIPQGQEAQAVQAVVETDLLERVLRGLQILAVAVAVLSVVAGLIQAAQVALVLSY